MKSNTSRKQWETKHSWEAGHEYWDVAQFFYLTLSHFQGFRYLSGGMNIWFCSNALHYSIKPDSQERNCTCHEIRDLGE